jgi:hypothetical protein
MFALFHDLLFNRPIPAAAVRINNHSKNEKAAGRVHVSQNDVPGVAQRVPPWGVSSVTRGTP